ncbi:MAG: LysR family transcriptional regulator [Sporolactobacillus sp.]
MDTKQLTTFKIAAECLNFTQTARRLNFAQSSITAQIQALEREIGCPLFERIGKRLRLTNSGHVFKGYADQVLRLTQETESAIAGALPFPTLTIGATETQCTYRLPLVLSHYEKKYPKAGLLIKPTNYADEIKEQLIDGIIDLGLIMGTKPDVRSITVKSLIDEDVWLLVSSSHPLSHTALVSSEELREETLLLTAKGCAYRTLLERAFAQNAISPKNMIEFVTVEAIKQCALAGLGVAYLPAVAVRTEVEKGDLVKINWPHAPASVPTSIAWTTQRALPANMVYFINEMQALYVMNR